MHNHKNPDGTYTYYIINGDGHEIPVIVEPGELADEMGEMDRIERNQNDYWHQNRDERIEKIRRQSGNPDQESDGDPLETIPDRKASVHDLAFPDIKEDDRVIIAVQHVIKTLSEPRRILYDQRYVQNIKQSDIARTEGVSREAVRKRDQKLRDEVKRKLAEMGITEDFIDRRKR